ncbi:MAG: AI-2E family transporter [Clostridia bacterium]|nr:AI-2E family transporter [Clostridia bacterium]
MDQNQNRKPDDMLQESGQSLPQELPQESPQEPQQTDVSSAKGKKRTAVIMSTSALIMIAVALVFYLIGNLPAFSNFLNIIIGLLNPILWGALIAYLCNPILRFWERRVLFKVRSFHVKRMLGIILTYLFVILVVAVFGLILVPSLTNSVQDLISNFENYIANAVTYINNLLTTVMEHLPADALESEEEFLSADRIITAASTLISQAGNLFDVIFNYLTTYASQLISGVTDVILAVFISFYLLSSKELRLAQIRKIVTAFCNEKISKFTFETASMMHNTFGRYFQGVILDAMIIFVVGLIVFSILKIPSALMIAFIVAITNIIPVFGPFLGAVPSAFIIFIIDPSKAIPFIIAILIMQQIDGNIIAPKILGQSTGISSLCVIVSLAIMGGIWGIFGMVVGVPVFAVIVTLIRQAADARLSKKNLSTDIDDYYVDEPETPEEPHKKGIMHSLLSLLRTTVTYAIAYTKYGVAIMKYRLESNKNKNKKRRIAAPRKEDYIPVRSKASPESKDTHTPCDAQDANNTPANTESNNDYANGHDQADARE